MERTEIIHMLQNEQCFNMPEFMKNERYFSIMVEYLKNMEVNSANIIMIKKYLQYFGLPIMIVFKPFYAKMTACDI